MTEPYQEHPSALARFYASRMVEGFGANLDRRLGWAIRDARATLDHRRARFWETVRALARDETGRRH